VHLPLSRYAVYSHHPRHQDLPADHPSLLRMILLTGDAGYIGTNLKPLLGEPVVGYDRLHGWELASMDKNAFRNTNIDTVVHLAADISVPESMKYPVEYYQNNLGRTIDLVRLAQDAPRVKHFVFASSAAVRGNTPYGWSKLYAEEVVKASSLNYAILRLENVVGGVEQHDNFIAKCFDYTLNDKGYIPLYNQPDSHSAFCERDFIHVLDVCRAIIAAVEYTHRGLSIRCDIGTGVTTNVLDVLKMVQKVTGQGTTYRWTSKPPRTGDIGTSCANPINDLDWSPDFNTIHKIVRQMWWEQRNM